MVWVGSKENLSLFSYAPPTKREDLGEDKSKTKALI